MARTVPVYAFQAADGSTIRFAVDSDLWITNLTGDDGLDVEMTEQQSTGQTGKTITGQSVGSRSLTVTGSILRDLDANEALLKRQHRDRVCADPDRCGPREESDAVAQRQAQLPETEQGNAAR